MNIVINAILYHEKPRGVGTYLNNLITQLASIDNDNNYYIYYGKWMKEYDFLKIKKTNFHFVEAKVQRNKIVRNLYQLIIFPFSALKYKPDIIHIPDTSPILFKTSKIVSTIHDIAEYVYPEKYSRMQALARKIIVYVQCKISDKVITVSSYSKKSIEKKFKLQSNKVRTIYNGVDIKKFEVENHKNDIAILKKYGVDTKKYFLFVGEIERTKNISVILDVLHEHKELNEYKLVVCGKKGNDYKNIEDKIEKLKLNGKAIFTGYVKDNELSTLYAHCFSFIFPSYFEGFGLPIIEAMASKAPVISSNASSLPEVGGDAIMTFSPDSSNELYKNIEKLIANSQLREKLIENGLKRVKQFTWDKSAKQTTKIYCELNKNQKNLQ